MSQQSAEFIMPFGKHRGQPLRELSVGYLEWLHSAIDTEVGAHGTMTDTKAEVYTMVEEELRDRA